MRRKKAEKMMESDSSSDPDIIDSTPRLTRWKTIPKLNVCFPFSKRKTISPKTVTTDATQNKKKRGLAVAEKTHPQKPPVLRKASTSSESAYNPFDDTDTEDTDQITSCDQVAPTQIARSKKKGKDHSQSTEKKRKRHPDTSDGEDASASSQPESKRRRKEIPSQKKTKTPRGLALAKNSKPKKQQTTPSEKETKRVREPQSCPHCRKSVINIWRHLKDIHSISSLPNKDLIRSKKGYLVKRCPYKGCLAVVDRLTDHLVRKHKVARKSYQIKRLTMRAEAIPSTLDVSGRKRQNVKKHIKKEDKIQNIEISSEDEPVKVKKEQITVNIKLEKKNILEKKDIIEISSEEKSCEEDSSEENRCEENSSEKNSCEENSSEENSSEENSSEESSSEDNSSGSSMIITDDSDEESAEQEEKKEYYFENEEIKEFIKYLQRPPYLKARKDALQHACQVWFVWGDLSKERKMKELINLDKLNDWLNEFLKHHAPGTARSYLSSIGLFVGHLVRQGFLRKKVGKALRFKEDIKLLSKQIRKKIQTRKTKLAVEEIETMITPEDFSEFWQSDVASEAEAKLKGEIPETIQQADFYHVRNYLLLRLLQSNAQRPGAIRNLTHQSIERAHTDNNGAVVMIADHKTAAQGPVNLGMSHEIFNLVLTYIKWTTRITGFKYDPKRPIFITFPTDQNFSYMSSNLVNKAIQNIWKKGPINQKTITATRIRKSTATHVRIAHPTSRESLAAHMTHSPETADRHYNMINHRNNAMTVTNLISDVMVPMKRANIVELQDDTDIDSNSESLVDTAPIKDICNSVHWPQSKQNDTEMDKEDEKETPMEKDNMNEEDIEMNEKDKEIDEEDGEDKMDEQEDTQKDEEDYREVTDDIIDDDIIDSQKGHHKRRSFEPEEAKILLEICSDNIKNGSVNLASIIQAMEEDDRGCQLLDKFKRKFGETYLKKIVDRVRCEFRKKQREQRGQK